jgi:uncharacterized protein (TIGR01777 family)
MLNHPSQVVVIAGASGRVGRALSESLEAHGHAVRHLVRREVRDSQREIYWDPAKGEIDADELNGVDAVVNLSGENIAGGRWTEVFKQRIRSSRVQSTLLLARTVAGLPHKPRVLCSASAIGFYGVRGDERLDENSPSGGGFLADLCREWEAANEPASQAGIRVVTLRIGVVMSRHGGALAKMLGPFKSGMGGVIGSGTQYISWIGLDDLVSAIEYVIDNDELEGPVNATAPQPVTNGEFTRALGRQLGRPTMVPVPAFALRLMVGREMADEMLLGGAKIYPDKLQQAGFEFRHPTIESALAAALDG